MSDTATPYIAADGPWKIIHDCQMTILSRVAASKICAFGSLTLTAAELPPRDYRQAAAAFIHQPTSLTYLQFLFQRSGICKSHNLANSRRSMEEVHGLIKLVNTASCHLRPDAEAI